MRHLTLNDVVSGSNGKCTTRKNRSKAYLCTGVSGYDGPTGLRDTDRDHRFLIADRGSPAFPDPGQSA